MGNKKIKRQMHSNSAVSEILGTVILLAMAVALFSVLYVLVTSSLVTTPSPSASLVGYVEGQSVIIEHLGGDSLDFDDSSISAIIGGDSHTDFVLDDSNGNGKWDIGERVVCYIENTGLRVVVTIIDDSSNSALFIATLQEGIIDAATSTDINTYVNAISPYEVTFSPLTIDVFSTGSTPDNVTLWYQYSSDNFSWWNENWLKRKSINLTVSSGSTSSNYQVLLNITYDSDMNNNFSDLRFVNYNDNTTELDYWIGIKSDGNWAQVWVEFGSSITTTNKIHAWMYYGNSGVNSKSNGTNTFDFFDDFSSQTYFDNHWNYPINSGSDASFEVTNGYLRIAGGSSPNIATAPAAGLNDYTIDFKFYFEGSVGIAGGGVLRYDNGDWYEQELDQSGLTLYRFTSISSYTQLASTSSTNNGNTWYDITFKVGGTSLWAHTEPQDKTVSTTDSNYDHGVPGVYKWDRDCRFDDYRVRKYASNEPTYSIGSEGNKNTGWMEWNNAGNPDTSSPWQWSFNFPNGTGYYEFYSIGRNDSNMEDMSDTADAICRYNITSEKCPIADWRFDEEDWSGGNNVVKDSANSYDGTAYDMTTKDSSTICGGICRVADFSKDSKIDYIKLPSTAINGLKDMSVSFWVNTSKNSGQQEIIQGVDKKVKDEFEIYLDGHSKIQVYIKNSGESFKLEKNEITDGTWKHVVITRNDDQVCLYIDGVQKECKTKFKTGALSIPSGGLILGQEQDSVGGGFSSNRDLEGYLDEFKIFNFSLTSERVKEIYAYEIAGKNYNGSPRQCPQSNKAISCWKLDENSGYIAYDPIGGNDGKIYGATWVTGVNGSALSFDGEDDYVDCGSDSSLDITSEITIESWIKRNELIPFGHGYNIVDRWHFGTWPNENVYGYRFCIVNNARPCFYFGGEYRTTDANTIDMNWNHVAVTLSASECKIYVNGVSRELDSTGGTIPSDGTPTPLLIGTSQDMHDWFNGIIDEVAIYDRALSENEIKERYEKNKPTEVGLWHFNEKSGTTAFDSAGNNDGKIYGASWDEGISGSALNFDGKENRVLVPDDESLDLSLEGTIETWIIIGKYTSYAGIIHKGEKKDFSDEAYSLQFYENGVPRVCLVGSSGKDMYVDGSKPLDTGEWYYVAAAWDSSKVYLYINGEEVGSKENTIGAVRDTKGSLLIGSRLNEQDEKYDYFGFDGSVDEVAIHNKMLSPEEIQNNYETLKPQ